MAEVGLFDGACRPTKLRAQYPARTTAALYPA